MDLDTMRRGLGALLRTGVLFACSAGGSGAQIPAEPDHEWITLTEALERALAVSPALAQDVAALSSAKGSRREAWGSFLPNVGLSSGASVQSTAQFDPGTSRVVSGSADSYNAGVSARHELFEGGRKFSELERTESAILEAEAQHEGRRFEVLLLTRTQFMESLRRDELVSVAEANVARASESLEITRVRIQAGTGTRSDSLRARLELANARQALLQAQNQRRAARYGLGRLVGADGPVVPQPPGDLDPAPLALEEAELMELAQSASPSVRAAQAAYNASGSSVNSARASYLPSVSLSSGYNWANNQRSFADGTTSWNLRLSATYPIFDGFQREVLVSQASEARLVAQLVQDDERRGVRQSADAALRTLETQVQTIDIARDAVSLAEEDLRITRERFRVGVSTILDVITSQVSLTQAEAELVSARYDYATARAALEAIVGREL